MSILILIPLRLFYKIYFVSFYITSYKVTQAIQATRQNMESITITMRGKLIEIQARQQGQRTQQQDQLQEN
jgi:hypothetical protein